MKFRRLPNTHLSAPHWRPRLVLFYGLVFTNLLIILLSANSLVRSRAHYEEAAIGLTQAVTNALELNITKSIEKLDFALLAIVDELERQLHSTGGIDEKSANVFLEIQAQRLPEVEAFRASRTDGLVILGKGLVKADNASWADRDDFIHHRNHADAGLMVSKPRLGRVAKQYIISLSRRYNHPDGSFAGTISAPIAVDHFTRLLSQFEVGSHGTLILRDAELGLISRVPPLPNNAAGQIGNRVVSPDFRQVFETGKPTATGFTTASPDGQQRVFTFHRLQAAPLVTIVAASKQDYLQAWTEEVYRTTAVAIGFLVLSLLLGYSQLRMLRQGEIDRWSIQENQTFLRNILDSLGAHVAVIDENGVITAVNASWRRFAADNGANPQVNDFVGVNYLGVCRGAEDVPKTGAAMEVHDGIQAVLSGRREDFSMKYPCHSPTEHRWFNLTVLPLKGVRPGAVIIHQNVTAQYEAEAKVRDSEERYRLLADNVTDVIWLMDLATQRFIYVSPSVKQLRGYTAEEVMAQPVTAALTPESAEYVKARMRTIVMRNAAGDVHHLQDIAEVDQPHRDGSVVHTEVLTRYLLGADGRVQRVLGVSRDITKRKAQEYQLRASEAHFRLLAENMGDIVWKADSQMRFTYINDADRRIRGFDRLEVLGFSISEALTPQGLALLAELQQRREEAESTGRKGMAMNFDIPMKRKQGGEVWIDISTIPIYDSEGQISGFQGIGRDITERKQQDLLQKQSHNRLEIQFLEVAKQKTLLQEQASHDPLTGVFNRRYLDEVVPIELVRAKREGCPVAVVMLDLDRFKRVNDQYGHAAGDEVLKALARMLKKGARDSDIVCRYGGEEFAVVMPGMTLNLAQERINALRKELEGMCTSVGEYSIGVTLSAGIAGFPQHGDNLSVLLLHADEMLYRAKDAGRNCVLVYDGGPAAEAMAASDEGASPV